MVMYVKVLNDVGYKVVVLKVKVYGVCKGWKEWVLDDCVNCMLVVF